MSALIILGLRGAQALFAVIILGLSAYVANWYNVDTLTSSPSQINFLLFTSLWTIISIGYLEGTPRFAPRAHNPIAAAAVEFLNALFYFSGFIALSVFLSRLLFCRGTVCGAARADVAFGVMEFLLWCGTCFFTAKDLLKAGFRKPSAPLGGPQMKEAQLA